MSLKSPLKTNYDLRCCFPAIPLHMGLGGIWQMGKKGKGLENSIHGNMDARENLRPTGRGSSLDA